MPVLAAIHQSPPSSEFNITKESIESELEVEQLLNEIGMLPDGYDSNTEDNGISSHAFVTPIPSRSSLCDEEYENDRASTVSVDEVVVEPVSSSNDDDNDSDVSEAPEVDIIANPKYVEKMEKFSVPNPMAAFSSVPNPLDASPPPAAASPPVPVAVAVAVAVKVEQDDESNRQQSNNETATMKSEKENATGVGTTTTTVPVQKSIIKIEPITTPSPLPPKGSPKSPGSPKSNNNNKRKADTIAQSGSDSERELTEEEMEARRVRNREHAKRSRLRKKSLTQTLQQSVDCLKAENRKMREMLQGCIGKQKADAIIEEQRSRSFRQFMASLQRPNGRVLDDQSLLYMKSLKRKVPKQCRENKKKSSKAGLNVPKTA